MNHFARRLLVATVLVFTFTFFMAPAADARGFGVPSVKGANFVAAAQAWLSSLFTGGRQAEMQTAKAESTRSKPVITSPGAGGGGMSTQSTGSCIDPLGNPVPCFPDNP